MGGHCSSKRAVDVMTTLLQSHLGYLKVKIVRPNKNNEYTVVIVIASTYIYGHNSQIHDRMFNFRYLVFA
jgi:hypothetical protein